MTIVKLHTTSVEVDEKAKLWEMEKDCPLFFKTKFGKRETYTVYKGCLIVRNTKTFGDGIPKRTTTVYLFTKKLENTPDLFHTDLFHIGGAENIKQAKDLIDLVLHNGSI